MRPLLEAQRDVLDAVPALPEQAATLREARGLVLAGDVVAPHDVPPFANSAMDGFAVRAADVAAAPVVLPVLEDVPAGSVPEREVTAGTSIKIMTGAPIPGGANAVVPVEQTRMEDGSVRIEAGVAYGTNVRPAGGDLHSGETVFTAGTRLDAAHVAVLASLGVTPTVRRRPVVAVMSTGDEIVPPETRTLAPGSIRDSNRPLLVGLLDDLGVSIVDYAIVRDDAEVLRRTLGDAAREADVVVTSGGVSMGEYDLVKAVLGELGTVEFWQVAMQPAKPFAFGFVGDTPLFGLPGNPVSVFTAFEQFVRPALLKMMGAVDLFRVRVPGRMGERVETDPRKEVFLRVRLEASGEGRPTVYRSGGQSSNVLSALATADALAVVPVGTSTLDVGQGVELELFRSPEGRTWEDALRGS